MAQLQLDDVPALCTGCGDPVDVGENFCGMCGNDLRHLQGGSPVAGERHRLECSGCGASLSAAGGRSLVCPFCKSPHVVEPPDAAGRVEPEFVVGFASTWWRNARAGDSAGGFGRGG